MPNDRSSAGRALDAARATWREANHANNAVFVSHRAKGWQRTDPAPNDLRASRKRLDEARQILTDAVAHFNGTWSLT